MRGDRQFEREYREWKEKEAPDLWGRIECQLKEHPEREGAKVRPGSRRVYGFGLAVAAAAVFVAVLPGLSGRLWQRGMDRESAAGVAENTWEEKENGQMVQEENGQVIQEETGQVIQEETGEGEAFLAEEGGDFPAQEKDIAARTEGLDGGMNPQLLEVGMDGRLPLPEGAVTVPEDASYFSEAILADTELLCSGTVEGVSLEYDGQGRAVKVVYQVLAGEIHYAQDYLDSQERILVKSPIVKTDGDEAYILYQLKEGSAYLLPLKKEKGEWELIYPFAPQVEILQDGAYLFHSGYASLVNQETRVVAGKREGENDYFYDRMLLRQDEGFLSQFLSLIKK